VFHAAFTFLCLFREKKKISRILHAAIQVELTKPIHSPGTWGEEDYAIETRRLTFLPRDPL